MSLPSGVSRCCAAAWRLQRCKLSPQTHCLAAGPPWLYAMIYAQDEEWFAFWIRPPLNVQPWSVLPLSTICRSVILMLPQARLMNEACVAASKQPNGLYPNLKPCWCSWAVLPLGVILMWVACAATWGHDDVHGLDCLQGPCLDCGPTEAGAMSMVCAVTRKHVEAYDLWSHWL